MDPDQIAAARVQLEEMHRELQCVMDAEAALSLFISPGDEDAAMSSAGCSSNASGSSGAPPWGSSGPAGVEWLSGAADEHMDSRAPFLRQQIACFESALALLCGAAAAATIAAAEAAGAAASELLAARLAARMRWEAEVQVRGRSAASTMQPAVQPLPASAIAAHAARPRGR